MECSIFFCELKFAERKKEMSYYDALPDHLLESINEYILHGRSCGGFLMAVFENNLREAVGRADDTSLSHLKLIVQYLCNKCPAGATGSVDRVREWQAKDGAIGMGLKAFGLIIR